jgi:hypothetical protein
MHKRNRLYVTIGPIYDLLGGLLMPVPCCHDLSLFPRVSRCRAAMLRWQTVF